MARKTWDSKTGTYVSGYSGKGSSLNPTGSSGTSSNNSSSSGGTTTYSHHVTYDSNNKPIKVTTTNNDTGKVTTKNVGSSTFVDPSVLQDAQSGMSAAEMAAKWGTTTQQMDTMLTNNEARYGTYYNGSTYSKSSSSPTLSTKSVVSPVATTASYSPDRNRYAYNNKSGYYEVVKNRNGMTYQEDPDYYGNLYDKDKFTPDAQYEWKTDNDWLNDALNGADAYRNDATTGSVDFVGDMNSNMNSFGAAVNNKLKTAFGIDNMAQLKEMYPEQYTSLVQSLNAVAGTWNALDPSQRQLLDGQLQAIIGTAVGAGSDTSKLNVLSESILSKFKDPDQVKQFVTDVTRLQTQGMNTAQIAEQMGVSEDMVQQGILAANGLDNKLGEHFELTPEAAKDITEDYDTKMERLEEEKRIALERANRNIEWLKEDFNKNYERQKQANEINLHNADFLSGQYGFGFSKRGLEGLNYVEDQAKQIIDDMVTNYDRTKIEMAEGVTDIIRNWERNNEDLEKACEDALTAAKNNYTSNMLAIQQQYGTVGMQAQQQMANNVQNFITQAENIYDNALQRQQQNLTNLITNFSNLNALQYSNLTLRNAKIQQFQSEALTMNRSQLQQLANQLGMSPDEYGDLLNYQYQAVQNQLNGYAPGAGIAFQDEISSLLESGANAQEVIQRVMNQPEFKTLQSTSGSNTWKSAGNGFLYDSYGNTKQIPGYSTSSKSTSDAKAATTDSNGNYQKVDLGYKSVGDMVDTGVSDYYAGYSGNSHTVKLAPEVSDMFLEAYNSLKARGIDLKVVDSYRSYEQQKASYDSGKQGVAKPGYSYHEKGQAFDLDQGDPTSRSDEVTQALLDAGFTRPVASEWWHWSYGEGKDAWGGKPRNSQAYDTARNILNGVGGLPSKNSTQYQDVVNALGDLKQQMWGDGYPTGVALINYSIVHDKELSDTLSTNISSTLQSIYSTDMLNKLLDDNSNIIGPILSRMEGWNPRNSDYAAISASINQMASNIARGFGEKGVLTDKDIERYMKTIPNEKMGKKSREVVGTLLKAKLYDGLVRTLETQAKSQRDVSAFAPEYMEAVQWLEENGFREKTSGGRGLQGSIDLSNRGRS